MENQSSGRAVTALDVLWKDAPDWWASATGKADAADVIRAAQEESGNYAPPLKREAMIAAQVSMLFDQISEMRRRAARIIVPSESSPS